MNVQFGASACVPATAGSNAATTTQILARNGVRSLNADGIKLAIMDLVLTLARINAFWGNINAPDPRAGHAFKAANAPFGAVINHATRDVIVAATGFATPNAVKPKIIARRTAAIARPRLN